MFTAPPAAKDSSPEIDPSIQKQTKVVHSEVEELEGIAVLPGQKRPFIHDDAVQIRTQAEVVPQRKRPRRDKVLPQPVRQEGSANIRTQADEESELKQLWLEKRKERGEKSQPEAKGRGRKRGVLDKSKLRRKSQLLTPGEIQQRRRGMLPKVEFNFVDEEP